MIAAFIYYGFPSIAIALLYWVIFEIINIHNPKAMMITMGVSSLVALVVMFFMGPPIIGSSAFMILMFALTLLFRVIVFYFRHR